MFSKSCKFVFLTLLFLLITTHTYADYVPRIGISGSTININRKPAVRFIKSNGALSAKERAQVTYQRLLGFVDEGLDPYTIQVKGDKKEARIFAGEDLICIVTLSDAKAAGVTTLSLAQSWAKQIRDLLLMPAITFSPKEILVPLSENRTVEIGGAAEGPITVKTFDESVATAMVSSVGRKILVQGRGVGGTSATVTVGGQTADLHITVKKYAGFIKGLPVVKVTGNPCARTLMEYGVKQEIIRSAELEPGAVVSIGQIVGIETPLEVASNRHVRAQVRIENGNDITYTNVIPVIVSNIALRYDIPDQLFYSNIPERLDKYQTLFAGIIEKDKSSRLLYHHQNMMGKRARFLIDVINPTMAPMSFRIFRGIAHPTVDTVLVGFSAGKSFMSDYNDNVSIIETVPAASRLILVSNELGYQQTASGIIQISSTDGTGAYVRVSALPPGIDDSPEGAIVKAPESIMLTLSEHVYMNPLKTIEANYEVGGKWSFINIGRYSITNGKDGKDDKKLSGNYGVTYDIKVKTSNPTDQRKKVGVVFDPTAGVAAGVFMINGELVSIRFIKPPTEAILKTFFLEPGEQKDLRIQTIPLSGSNYPAVIVVRPF